MGIFFIRNHQIFDQRKPLDDRDLWGHRFRITVKHVDKICFKLKVNVIMKIKNKVMLHYCNKFIIYCMYFLYNFKIMSSSIISNLELKTV